MGKSTCGNLWSKLGDRFSDEILRLCSSVTWGFLLGLKRELVWSGVCFGNVLGILQTEEWRSWTSCWGNFVSTQQLTKTENRSVVNCRSNCLFQQSGWWKSLRPTCKWISRAWPIWTKLHSRKPTLDMPSFVMLIFRGPTFGCQFQRFGQFQWGESCSWFLINCSTPCSWKSAPRKSTLMIKWSLVA